MNTIKRLLVITTGTMIIAACQGSGNNSDVEGDTMSVQHPAAIDNTKTKYSKYVDLNSTLPVHLYYDPKTKRTYSEATNEPVDLYVNVETGDTIYGQGRFVVNNYIVKTTDGTYKLDDSKVKVNGDELKIKDGDKKLKLEDGEMKIKDGDEKLKAEENETKLKTDEMKKKKEDGETKTKKE